MSSSAVVMRRGARPSRWRKVALGVGVTAVVALAVAAGGGAWLRVQLGRSLPQLDGEQTLAGLGARVVVERDDLGVPTVRGTTRVDVARALGFVHAQERFFQMDLARRRGAGELAELFGAAALPVDRAARLHRLRARASRVLAEAEAEGRFLLEAYTAGVNAGLAALGAPPFEYLLLRTTPRAWVPEDSVLVVASMFFSLQDSTASTEARAALLAEVFPEPLAEFLNTTASEWDTPLEGEARRAPTAPPAAVFDLRTTDVPRAAARVVGEPGSRSGADRDAESFAAWLGLEPGDERVFGSNNWAVAGSLTADGRAILANDMHLAHGVPNIWFRASLAWTSETGAHRVTGVTLPGVPNVVAGSNGLIAWGFTNTTADWSDRVRIETVEGDPTLYVTPSGPRAFDAFAERIVVKGAADDVLEVRETEWGPIAPPDHRGRLFAIAWVAHSPEGLNLRLSGVERAGSIDEAFAVANVAGIPGQNFVVADRAGNIGWSVAGRIPRREGFDGQLPVSWADGTRRWRGWYSPSEYPRVVNPAGGRIVTANNRVAGGAWLEMLGDGGYDPGARARQILEGLRALDTPRVGDMLRVQLDDRGVLMERWRDLALGVLTPAHVAAGAHRDTFRRLLAEDWTGRAEVGSVPYRLVREFRTTVSELVFEPFVTRLRVHVPDYPRTPGRSFEGPLWALVHGRPPHLLDPRYRNWDALLLDAVDRTSARLTEGGRRLDERSWGEANTVVVRHPLSRAVPWLGWWLDMPHHALPGDVHMPRVQGTASGASERFAVSPGHEDDGYFHMPTGQSGHPLSPHYRDGHAAWVRGEPTPFLPGPTVSRLELRP